MSDCTSSGASLAICNAITPPDDWPTKCVRDTDLCWRRPMQSAAFLSTDTGISGKLVRP